MLRGTRYAAASFTLLAVVAAIAALFPSCGSRTALQVPQVSADASVKPVFDGGPLDVEVECASPSYCDPSDAGYLWRCGQRVFQCSSLEQCEERESGAECVNPCLDSLGNNTSNGCEFYAVEMDTTQEVAGVCYAVFVVNQWKTGQPARIEVTLGSTVLPIEQFARIPAGKGTTITYGPYDSNAGLPANQVALLFLSRDPNAAATASRPDDPRALANCPPGVVPAVQGDASLHGTGIGTAFHIQTNVPVVAYQMLPYGGGRARVTGSTLLLPTSAWDVNYLVADAYQASQIAPEASGSPAVPTTVVIASQDGTNVTVKPTADILAGDHIGPAPQGRSTNYVIDQGHYLQFTQTAELTGTAIQSDKPVAVIGGNTLLDLPPTIPRADSAEQMLAPVRALGSEYVAVRYRSRSATEEVVPWRLVGAADGTRLTYEPAPPTGAPTQLQAQQLAEFDSAGPFVVRSQDAQHPFYLASYMTGGQSFNGTGDPEFVSVVPPAQYLPRYTFFTDPTYPETNLVVVRALNPSSRQMPDVTLDCAGTLSGWTPVGTSGIYEMVRVDLSTGDFQSVHGCDNGVHVISSAAAGDPFGVTVWGWGNDITWPTDDAGAGDEENPLFTRWVSYGYPAGANFAPLNTVVLSAR